MERQGTAVMQMIVIKSPKCLAGLLRMLFGIKKEGAAEPARAFSPRRVLSAPRAFFRRSSPFCAAIQEPCADKRTGKERRNHGTEGFP